MIRAYDCGIETNHDAWHAVHQGIEDGLSFIEISSRTDLSYQMVGVYARQPRPASIRRRINRNSGGAHRCIQCGAATAHATHKGIPARCQTCAHNDQAVAANMPARRELLRAWAIRHGYVPNTNEAAALLGLSRGRAGDVLIGAFGPDHRIGYERRQSRRGWPNGAPDVPIDADGQPRRPAYPLAI